MVDFIPSSLVASLCDLVRLCAHRNLKAAPWLKVNTRCNIAAFVAADLLRNVDLIACAAQQLNTRPASQTAPVNCKLKHRVPTESPRS